MDDWNETTISPFVYLLLLLHLGTPGQFAVSLLTIFINSIYSPSVHVIPYLWLEIASIHYNGQYLCQHIE